MSDKLTTHQKLIKIQQELNAPKNQYNAFGKYNYRSCEDILEAVKPLLKELECFIILFDEIVATGEIDTTMTEKDDETYLKSGERAYVKATALFTDGEREISTTAFAKEAISKKGMDASQITGSASSYARKYALNGLLLIDDAKDADTKDNRKQSQKSSKADDLPF